MLPPYLGTKELEEELGMGSVARGLYQPSEYIPAPRRANALQSIQLLFTEKFIPTFLLLFIDFLHLAWAYILYYYELFFYSVK